MKLYSVAFWCATWCAVAQSSMVSSTNTNTNTNNNIKLNNNNNNKLHTENNGDDTKNDDDHQLLPRQLQMNNAPYFVMIAAPDYSDMQGVGVQETSEGIAGLGFLDPGDYVAYAVDIPRAGDYTLQMRIASPDGQGSFIVGNMEAQRVLHRVSKVPATGDWNNWETLETTVTLPEGQFSLQVGVLVSGWNLLWLSLASQDFTSAPTKSPTIEVIEVVPPPPPVTDLIDPIVATVEDSCYAFMAAKEFVEMECSSTMTTSGTVAFTKVDDYATYEFDIPADGIYLFQMGIASPDGMGAFELVCVDTGTVYATVDSLLPTGTDEEFDTVSLLLTLPQGSHELKVLATEPTFYLSWLCLDIILSSTIECEDDLPVLPIETMMPSTAPTDCHGETNVMPPVTEVPPPPVSNVVPPPPPVSEEVTPPVTEEVTPPVTEEVTPPVTEEVTPPVLPPVAVPPVVPGVAVIPEIPDVIPGGTTCFGLNRPAVEFDEMEGIATQETGGGVTFIGFLDEEDFVTYEVTIPYSSQYQFSVWVASPGGEGSFEVVHVETETVVWTPEAIPETADWETFDPVRTNLILNAGVHTLRFNFLAGGFNMERLQLIAQTDPTGFELDILAADFVTSVGVDVVGTGDAATVNDIGPNDYVAYDVLIPADGLYYVDLRVGSPIGEGGFEVVHLPSMTILATMPYMPITGDFTSIETSSVAVSLPAGCHRLAIRGYVAPVEPVAAAGVSWRSVATGWILERVRFRYLEYLEPGIIDIKAADYVSQSGVFVEEKDDGTSNLIFLDAGDYMVYEIVVPYDEIYLFEMWVAAPSGEGAFSLVNLNTLEVYGEFNSLPVTGNWETWEPVSATFPLPAGEHSLMVRVATGGANIQRMRFTRQSTSFSWTEVRAADYDAMVGGAVIVSPKVTNLAFLDPTDFAIYTITIPAYGLYQVNLRVASPSGEGSVEMIDLATMDVLTTINNMPFTGSWDKYDTASANVVLPPGTHEIMLRLQSGGFNLERLQIITQEETDGFELYIPSSDFSSMQGVVVEAEDAVTDLDEGDFVAYEMIIPADGSYYLEVRTASPLGTGGFEVIDMDTLEVIVSVDTLPITDTFDVRETISIAAELTAGVHNLMVQSLEPGWLLESFKVEYTEAMMNPLVTDIKAEDLVLGPEVFVLTAEDGSTNLGFLDPGDYVEYTLEVADAGHYKFEMWVASPGGEGGFDLELMEPEGGAAADAVEVLSTISIMADQPGVLATFDTMPRTGSWDSWEAVGKILDLAAGEYTLRINVLSGGANIQRLRLTYQPAIEDLSLLYGANDYYALAAIYIENGEIPNLSFIDAGDWMAFTITIPASGVYQMNFRVAGFGDGAFEVSDMDTKEPLVAFDSVPNTGGWQTYDILSTDYSATPGRYRIRIDVLQGGFNFQSLELVPQTSPETYDFDLEAVDFAVMMGIGIENNDPLLTGMTLAPGEEPVTNVGFLDPGDFVAYEVLIPADDTYYVDLLVASPEGKGSFNLVHKPTEAVLSSFSTMPITEEWDEREFISFAVELPAGYHTLAISVVEPGFNFERIRFHRMDSKDDPGLIELVASEFTAMDGVAIIEEDDGGTTVAFLDPGDWMSYAVVVPFEAAYRFEVFVASPSGEGGFELVDLRTLETIASITSMPVTGSWDNYEYAGTIVELPPGEYTLMVRVLESGANLKALKFTKRLTPEGLPIEILASNYYTMVGAGVEVNDAGMANVAFLGPGDTLTYQVTVPAFGVYRVDFRVASPSGEGALDLVHLESGETLASLESMPSTGGWSNWDAVSVDINLQGGTHTLALQILEQGWNFERLQIGISPSSDGFGINIPAADFVEMQGIEVEEVDGTILVTSLDAGDLVAYDVIIPTAGTYFLDLSVGSPDGAGSFEMRQGSTQSLLAVVNEMPITGESRQGISMAMVLPAGYHTLEVQVLEPGWTLERLALSFPAEPESLTEMIFAATDYTSSFGVEVQTPDDTGIPHVGFLDPGDWFAYPILIPFDAEYTVEIVVASPAGEGSLELVNLETLELLGSLDTMPVTGDWATWETASTTVDFVAGNHILMIRVLEGGANLQTVALRKVVDEGAVSISILPSMYYSLGGAYLQDPDKVGDVVYISFLDPGDWAAFQVEIPEDGTYQLDLRVASPNGEGILEIAELDTGANLGALTGLPASGAWNQFQVATTEIELTLGVHTIVFRVLEGGFNMANFQLTK